ncbi:hypothetical protein BHE74_00047242 [Ensete ventricosum]|nr:hypothetical protein BHE74_00047242 [Ensete ventricosum]
MGAQSALLHFLALSFFVWSHAAEDKTRDLSVEEDRELERELKTLNKPFVKSFQDKYGITYDCVDIYKQPAFDHPLLKNHTLQFPKRNRNINETSTQHKFPKRCPTGTVLIRRTTKEDLVRAKKYAQHIQSRMQQVQLPTLNDISKNHYATVQIHAGEGAKFYGVSASFYAYQLYLSLFQGTASRIILTKGERGPKKYLNAVEAGWHVITGCLFFS